MQRSRKALLQKRAAVSEMGVVGRNKLYKVSLSVLLLWGIIILLSSLTSYGNGPRDGLGASVGESSWHQYRQHSNDASDSLGDFSQSEVNLENHDQGTPVSMGVDVTHSTELPASVDANSNLLTVEDERIASHQQHQHQQQTFDTASAGSDVADDSTAQNTQPERNRESDAQSEVISDMDDHKMINSMGEDAGVAVETSATKGIKADEENSDDGIKERREIPLKSDRLSRAAAPGLDEFKSKLSIVKEKHGSSQSGTVIHRVEPGGKEYNYASAKNGAKVLAYNKEAKGPSNILDKDKDKYLRNPCSAEGKYIVIELSEETLVDVIEMANFEHYSSNLKDFELLSSLSYPTDNWIKVGHFTAANVKHEQKFTLPEPKWSRYLKINLLNHYGSEFYCTLSLVEVYGVDAVERMLEDLISVENKRMEFEEQNAAKISVEEPIQGDDLYQELFNEIDNELGHGSSKMKLEGPKNSAPDPSVDAKPHQVGRMPGDTVLKILMQKVQTLDVSFAILEGYLEELNNRNANIFKEFDDDIAAKDLVLEKVVSTIKNLEKKHEIFTGDIEELLSWKSSISSKVDQLVKENSVLRLDANQTHDRQAEMENKGFAVIFICAVLASLASVQLFIGFVLSICRKQSEEISCRTSSAWLVLLLSSSFIAFILII